MSQEQGDVSKARLSFLVGEHFQRLVKEGVVPNEAAVQALALAKAEVQKLAVESQPSETPKPAEATPAEPPKPATPTPAVASTAASATEDLLRAQRRQEGHAKYGPLCLGLAGPFQSICICGEPRPGKKLLVLDIDHTIYDPSEHGGSKGSVVRSGADGRYDESVVARCRPGLHEFLIEAYKEYDLMVWSASDMIRILTLLQQLGILTPAGQSEYQIVAVLDVDSMSEAAPTATASVSEGGSVQGAVVQTVVVPLGALPGQQIEVQNIRDGSPMVVAVPAGKQPGETFNVTLPGAVSAIGQECGLDADEVQMALLMSMGIDPDSVASSGTGGTGSDGAKAPISKARKKGRSLKPLSLIWACAEFSQFYSEMNTIIVDDTIDVCSANPQNSIHCIRYFWKDHGTDIELKRLTRYLATIAQAPEFPKSHERWRDGLDA